MIKEKKLNVWLINTKRIIRKLIGDLHMHMPVERRSECVYTCRRDVIIYWLTTSALIVDLFGLSSISLPRIPYRRNDLEIYVHISELRRASYSPGVRSSYSARWAITARLCTSWPCSKSAHLIIIYFRNANDGEVGISRSRGSTTLIPDRTDFNGARYEFVSE